MNELNKSRARMSPVDHGDPFMAFKQRSFTLEFHFRWITPTVGVVDRFKRNKDRMEEDITIV